MHSNTLAPVYRILVAEDDEWIRNLLVRVLSDAGYRPYAVNNGIDAMEELTHLGYELAILDVQMPGMGAVEIARQHRLSGRAVPIMVLTADATSETAEQCRNEGVHLVLAKPVRPDDLLRSVEALVNRTRLAVLGSKPAQSCDDLINQETLRRLVQTCGQEFVDQLLNQFQEQVDVLITEIEQSYSIRNFASLDELLHRFEGTAGTVGASAIANVARELRERLSGPDIFDIDEQLTRLRGYTHSTVRALRNQYHL